MRRSAALLLLTGPLVLLGGCSSGPHDDPDLEPGRHALEKPKPTHVREAVDELGVLIRRHYDVWPEHVARSRDFPDLPLVELPPVEDRSDLRVDTRGLFLALEEAVRGQGRLRLLADELAVPPSLREGEDEPDADAPPEPAATLRLVGWVDTVGRFRLELHDLVREGEVLLRARSRDR